MLIKMVTNNVDFAITKQQIENIGGSIASFSDAVLEVVFDDIDCTIKLNDFVEIEKDLYRTCIFHTAIMLECLDLGSLTDIVAMFPFIRDTRLCSIEDLCYNYSTSDQWLRANASSGMTSGIGSENINQKTYPNWVNAQLAKKLDCLVTEHREKVNDLVDLYLSEEEFIEMDPPK